MRLDTRWRHHADRLRRYCIDNGYNSHIAIMIDYGRHSGRRRFVVWNFDAGKPLCRYPVSHGSGSDRPHRPSAYARFSNVDGSHLSSLGHALVAERYTGRYGTAYRLDGLDDTNSNLRSRCIVLHGWAHTASHPIWPFPTTGSWGCPVLSRRAMRHVDTILQNANNVILFAFAE